MTTIEIEDYDGNTLCAFQLFNFVELKDIEALHDCDVADIGDGDYIFKSDENRIIRIQLTR